MTDQAIPVVPSPAIQAPLPYFEAASLVLEHARSHFATFEPPRFGVEAVSLLAALGRVLAEPVLADRDQPPFPRSTRDGFACRADDAVAGRPLRVLGMLRAGEAWAGEVVSEGQAVEIMTGAPLPSGADCVVMIEHVQIEHSTDAGAALSSWLAPQPGRPAASASAVFPSQARAITLSPGRSIAVGENVIPRGAEAQHGALLLAAGTRLHPPQIAAIAACGHAQVSVVRRPRVAILSTGDELVELDATPLAFQIRNSNSYSLAAQVLGDGGEPVILPIAADESKALEAAIREALSCDMLLLSGGVSMGKYDLVEPVLLSLGAEFFFTGAKIQPGKPVVFGRAQGRYFVGLPGNPVSTMVTFALFGAPLLAALGGEPARGPRFVQATLSRPVQAKPGLTRFLPAKLTSSINGSRVAPVSWQGSGDLAGTSLSDCFLVVPEPAAGGETMLQQGSLVSVLLAG